MTIIKDGGYAFPLAITTETTDYHGMSLRDWFAGQALAGLLADSETAVDCSGRAGKASTKEIICKMAYEAADAMLAAREVQP